MEKTLGEWIFKWLLEKGENPFIKVFLYIMGILLIIDLVLKTVKNIKENWNCIFDKENNKNKKNIKNKKSKKNKKKRGKRDR